jgi:dynein heavy chain
LSIRIINKFEEVTKTLLTMPNTVEEMVQLQNYLNGVRTVEIKSFEQSVDDAKSRYT